MPIFPRHPTILPLLLLGVPLALAAPDVNPSLASYQLDFATPVDSALQQQLEIIDQRLRARFEMASGDAAAGLLDLQGLRLAMIHPDRGEYAASIPKIGILLAWFDLHPESTAHLDDGTRHELGLMIKASSNSAATRFSRELGLQRIQQVLNAHGLYDARHGGGLWIGKHYGSSEERYGDPLGDNSHAATVRQLLRFFLWLEQGRLISPEASKTMREVFESPEIPHDPVKFVKGLEGRNVQIIRKWGSWENWRHDAAVITGPGRRYILVGLTHHPSGDDYLVELAKAADDLMRRPAN